ncbi:MAG: hypothetical protein HOO67_06960 [Candidatus Peribacteraceae bacterium]|nr:hypothetical protein [Candidatus Peribacteraceae bacterium]
MKLLRLRGRKTCDRLIRQGNVWKGRHMVVRWLPGHPRHPGVNRASEGIYVGTLASTKLDKSAVKRNRMRRRCRESLRIALKTLDGLPTTQLLLAPRSTSLGAPFAEIQSDISAFLSSRSHGRAPKAQ